MAWFNKEEDYYARYRLRIGETSIDKSTKRSTLFISLLSTYINALLQKLTSVAEGMSRDERRKGEPLSMMTLLKYTNVALIQNAILHVWSFGRSKQDQRKERRLRMTSCVFEISPLLNMKASIPNTISRSSGRSIVKKARAKQTLKHGLFTTTKRLWAKDQGLQFRQV